MPYHNVRAAHKRLLEKLPAHSPYRQTVATSVWAMIAELWRRAAENRNQRSDRPPPLPRRIEHPIHRPMDRQRELESVEV
jgi:hypothetical protein